MVDDHSLIGATVGTVLMIKYNYIRCMTMIQGTVAKTHDLSFTLFKGISQEGSQYFSCSRGCHADLSIGHFESSQNRRQNLWGRNPGMRAYPKNVLFFRENAQRAHSPLLAVPLYSGISERTLK